MVNDSARSQREIRADEFADLGVGDVAGAEGIDVDADRFGDADGVGELEFAAIGEAGRNDVLGHVAGHVGCAAVDLGWVFAAEGAAAVTAHAAVGVDDNLAPGEAAVAVRSADHEASGRVDVVLDLALDEVRREDWLDDLVDHEVLNFGVGDFFIVLRGDDDGVDTNRAIFVILDCDLALAVGTKPVDFLLLAGFRQAIGDAVREGDRQRHQFGRFITGVAEHESLVAGADVLTLGFVGVHALSDVGALLVDADHYRAGIAADAGEVVGVTNIVDDLANDALIVDNGFGGDFASDDGDASRYHGFAGDAAHWVLSEDGVEDAVGDLVSQLVWMAHADGFASE